MLGNHKIRTPNPGMQALLIYDNFACAARANATLQRAAQRANAAAQWNVTPWRLDALRLPPAADEALLEAVDADLIVFAGARAQSLPSWLQDWLGHWAMLRRVGDVALAAMGATVPAGASRELFKFAERHGLNVIVDEDAGAEHASVLFNHSQSVFYPRFLPAPVSLPLPSTHSSWRNWGINE
jgi:hypothetical protein